MSSIANVLHKSPELFYEDKNQSHLNITPLNEVISFLIQFSSDKCKHQFYVFLSTSRLGVGVKWYCHDVLGESVAHL